MSAPVFTLTVAPTLATLPPEILCNIAKRLPGRWALSLVYALRTDAEAHVVIGGGDGSGLSGGSCTPYTNLCSDYVWRAHLERDFHYNHIRRYGTSAREFTPCCLQYKRNEPYALQRAFDVYRALASKACFDFHLPRRLNLVENRGYSELECMASALRMGIADIACLARYLRWGRAEVVAATTQDPDALPHDGTASPRALCTLLECAMFFNPNHAVAAAYVRTRGLTYSDISDIIVMRTAFLRHGYTRDWFVFMDAARSLMTPYRSVGFLSSYVNFYGMRPCVEHCRLVDEYFLPVMRDNELMLTDFVVRFFNVMCNELPSPGVVAYFRRLFLTERRVATCCLLEFGKLSDYTRPIECAEDLAPLIDAAIETADAEKLFAIKIGNIGQRTFALCVQTVCTKMRYAEKHVCNWRRRLFEKMLATGRAQGIRICESFQYFSDNIVANFMDTNVDTRSPEETAEWLALATALHDGSGPNSCYGGRDCHNFAVFALGTVLSMKLSPSDLFRERPACAAEHALDTCVFMQLYWPHDYPDICVVINAILDFGKLNACMWSRRAAICKLLRHCADVDDVDIDSDTTKINATWTLIRRLLECMPSLAADGENVASIRSTDVSYEPMSLLIRRWAPTTRRFAEMAHMLMTALARAAASDGIPATDVDVDAAPKFPVDVSFTNARKLITKHVMPEAPELARALLAIQ